MSWGREKNNMWGNGDGRFFYPPLEWKTKPNEPLGDDPIETVRLEHLRDGMEDWEYFTTLKEISSSKDMSSDQKSIAKKLLDIPNSIVGITDTEYAITPDEMLERRHEVGKFIDAYFCGEEYLSSSSSSSSSHSPSPILTSLSSSSHSPVSSSSLSSSTSKGANESSYVRPVSFLTMAIILAVVFTFHRY